MYYHVTSTSFSRLRLVVVCAVLLVGAVKEGYGQVYANSYGIQQSGDVTVLGLVVANGTVHNAENSLAPVIPDVNYSRLTISGLTGIDAYARLQLKFINGEENLPAGTPIYVRVANLGTGGLLNLLLGGSGAVTASKDATSTVGNPINGTQVPITSISTVTDEGNTYLKIIPADCFNAVSINITGTALLPAADLWVYHAYYECLSPISVFENPTICFGEEATLQVEDPLSSSNCNYRWYDSATGGNLLGTGASYITEPLTSSTTFYVGYSGLDPSKCGRTPVVVTVVPQPGKPHLTITDVHN